MTSSFVSIVPCACLSVFTLACASTPTDPPAPAMGHTATEVVDLRELHAPDMNLERLVQVCQPYTGANFTYAAEVRSLLLGTRVMVKGDPHLRANEVASYVRGVLEANGFTCSPVGPEDLRVFEIRQREG